MADWRAREYQYPEIAIPQMAIAIIDKNFKNIIGKRELKLSNPEILLEIKTTTEEDLHLVQKEIYARLKAFSKTLAEKDDKELKKSELTREISFGKLNKEMCKFWMHRFRKIAGIKHIACNTHDHGNLIRYIYIESTVDSIDPIKYLINSIEINGNFIDSNEIWKRARCDYPQLIKQSSYTKSIVLDAIFIQRFSLSKIEELNHIYGVDYIDVEGKPEDTVVSVQVGARFPNVVEYVITELRKDFDDFKARNKNFYEQKNVDLTIHTTTLPVPCSAGFHMHQKLPNISDTSFLQSIFNDPSVTKLELDLTGTLLTISCSSVDSLEEIVFKVRKHLSFEKRRPWRTVYNCNRERFFKFNIDVEDICSANVRDIKDDENNLVDVVDVINKDHCFYVYKVLHEIVVGKDKGVNIESLDNSKDLRKMKQLLAEFIQFDDFVNLENIEVRTWLGQRFFSTKLHTRKFDVFKKGNEENSLWHLGENFKYSVGCRDLKLPHNYLVKFLCSIGYSQCSTRRYTLLKFHDLSTNQRYEVELDENEFAFIHSCQEESNVDLIKIKTLRNIHLILDVIGTVSENQRLVQSTLVTSKPFVDYFDYSEAKEFVKNAMKHNEIRREGVMSINNRYSMDVVCYIEQYDFKSGEIVVQIEKVTKKSIQMYGKFTVVSRFYIFCPALHVEIKNLQKDVNNETLKASVLAYFEGLIIEGERVTDEINVFLDTNIIERLFE